MADVTVLGKSVPKGGLYAGFAIGLGITGVILWRKHEAAKNAPVTAAPGAYAYGYGAAAAGYGYGYGMNIAAYGYGSSGGLGGGYGYGYGYGGGGGEGVTVPPTTVPPQSNALWAEAAESYLSQNLGYNPTTVAAALGKYLVGATVTQDQAAIVQAAIAFENYPPTAGANGYPPAIHDSPSTGQTKPGTGTGKEVGHRHRASGTTSLNTWAKQNKTTAGEVTDTTEANYTSGYMTTANHTAFDKYLNKGTSSKMPVGLVFFSAK